MSQLRNELKIINARQGRLYRESTIQLLECLSHEMVFVSDEVDRCRYVDAWFSSNASPCFLLLKDSYVIGILATDWNGSQSKELWIELVAVRASYRGLGYGNTLLSTAVDYIRNNTEYKALSLTVSSNNQIAINLYKKYGFNSDNRLALSYQKMTLVVKGK